MEYRYHIDTPGDLGGAKMAEWLVDRAKIRSARWNTKKVSVEAVLGVLHSSTIVDIADYGYATNYVYTNDSVIRWRYRGAVCEVVVTYDQYNAELDALRAAFPPVKPCDYLRWFYAGKHGPESVELELSGAEPHPEFYPGIKDLGRLYSDFVNSTANVMLLIGPPGTGKTTFIRGLLRASGMQAWVTYDEAVQRDEKLYVRFASVANSDDDDNSTPYDEDGCQLSQQPDDGRILVMEDADTLLESRGDGNKLMGRLLNLSDGLATLPARKLIFSTNLPTLTSVDAALRRPGRCFAAVNFRALTAAEATKACKAIGRSKKFSESVTLSEALNDQSEFNAEVVRRVGFS